MEFFSVSELGGGEGEKKREGEKQHEGGRHIVFFFSIERRRVERRKVKRKTRLLC